MWKRLGVQKQFDRYADQAAQPIRWRHMIWFGAFGNLVWFDESPWFAISMFIALLWLVVALSRRRETLKHFRADGIDPYNKKQVEEYKARLHRELQEQGIIPRSRHHTEGELPGI
jgi:hypothetical protein